MPGIKRVPVILQMEAVECGAASLGMILAYYGKWIPLEKLRSDCGVSRDGSNARALLMAARQYGLEANGYKMEPDGLTGVAPAIIHWNLQHFVVFKGIRKGKAYLNDPASGCMVVPLEEFSRSFTGVVLSFRKGENFVADGKPTSILRFIQNRLSGAKEAFLFTFLMGAITAVAGLITPLFAQVFMDHILSGKNASWATPFLLSMTAMAIFSFILTALNITYRLRLTANLSIQANAGFMWHTLNLPINFFSQRYVGDIIFRQRSNQNITATLVETFAPLLINLALLVLYLLVMSGYSLLLTTVGVGALFLNMITIRYIAKNRQNAVRAIGQKQGKFYGVMMSCLDNIESIKAVGGESGFFEYWAGYFANLNNAMVQNDKYSTMMNIIPMLLTQITNGVVLLLGVGLILNGEFTIGMLLAFQGFMSSFMTPIGALQHASTTVINMRSQMELVEDVFKYPTDTRGIDSRDHGLGKLKGKLEMRRIKFGYNPHLPPLIDDFSLTLSPGKSVAFVGASGCGKSTLAKLISGLYQPWEGEILFDDRPMSGISHQEFVNSVAVIDQNIVLFDDTLSANIKMWDSSIEDFTMIMACNDAQIRRDITERPEGFSAQLVKGGNNFSGGQRQRIEIATALAREPIILIMDEATSALDAETEKQVMQSIRFSGITLVIVAHRLSTVRDCDEIIVMDKGKIIERGTHEQLVEKGGRYKELMESN